VSAVTPALPQVSAFAVVIGARATVRRFASCTCIALDRGVRVRPVSSIAVSTLIRHGRDKSSRSHGSDRRQFRTVETVTLRKVWHVKKSPFRAVSVASKNSRCSAVALIEGVRYLCSDAPQLPLKACERAKTCRCVFVHHDDRRQDARRDSDAGIAGFGYIGSERRTRRGRRASDRQGTPRKYGNT